MTLFADQSREQLRAVYGEVWHKWRVGSPLQPLEAQIAEVIAAHPEYHALLEAAAGLQQQFDGGDLRENPFLHMGLHLALREQLGTDRPAGIAALHRRLTARSPSAHAAEHRMIEVLAAVLAEAQRCGLPPQQTDYLERLRRL